MAGDTRLNFIRTDARALAQAFEDSGGVAFDWHPLL